MSKKEVIIVVIKDGFVRGVLGDVVMYGLLLGLWYVNYRYLGNSWFIGLFLGLLIIMFIMNLFSGMRKVFYSKEEAAKYLSETKEGLE